ANIFHGWSPGCGTDRVDPVWSFMLPRQGDQPLHLIYPPAVDNEVVRVKGHLRIEVVLQHVVGGFDLPVFARQLRAAWGLNGPGHQGLLVGRHVQGWRIDSTPDMESALAKMTCHRGAANLQRTPCATSAVDDLLKSVSLKY